MHHYKICDHPKKPWLTKLGRHGQLTLWLIMLGLGPLTPAFAQPTKSPAIHMQVDVNQTIGSTTPLHNLIEAVGHGHRPSSELVQPLRELGTKRIRLINVDYVETQITTDEQGNKKLIARALDNQLDFCEKVGASPHVIIGQKIPPWLSTHKNNPWYGPRDWKIYDDYIRRLMEHVIVTRGFRQATWEVGNEPDTGHGPVIDFPRGPKGSKSDYLDYLNIYRHIATIAAQLEKKLGIPIKLGGPASGLLKTYKKFKAFNWYEHFLQDVAREQLKCDFFSFHYYGHASAIGDRANPPRQLKRFGELMTMVHGWINKYHPGLPVWITEWGASGCLRRPGGLLNATNVGAAWIAAFVPEMLRYRVERAIFLVVADREDNWVWPALFHGTTPKPSFYVFRMFKSLKGQMLAVKGGSTAVGAVAARENHDLAILLWNYDHRHGWCDAGYDAAKLEKVSLRVTGLPANQQTFQVTQTMVSEEYGNPFYQTLPGKKASPEPLIQDLGKRTQSKGGVEMEISLPPSAVILLEFSPGAGP
ncbi:MAG: GH39 family glycosyl hydrolase [Desulfobacteraceae bacterium]